MAGLERHVSDFVEAARETVSGISAESLADEIEEGTVTVVDVRRAAERRERGAIPGAEHVPRGGLEYAADPESAYYEDCFEVDRRYVCHCSGGSRGALAAARLDRMGYQDVAYLEDGFAAWREADLPVEAVEDEPAGTR